VKRTKDGIPIESTCATRAAKEKKESDLLWYVQFQLAFVSGLLANTMGYGQKPYAFVSC